MSKPAAISSEMISTKRHLNFNHAEVIYVMYIIS